MRNSLYKHPFVQQKVNQLTANSLFVHPPIRYSSGHWNAQMTSMRSNGGWPSCVYWLLISGDTFTNQFIWWWTIIQISRLVAWLTNWLVCLCEVAVDVVFALHGWMVRCNDINVFKCMYLCVYVSSYRCIYLCISNKYSVGHMVGWMDGKMDGWMNG